MKQSFTFHSAAAHTPQMVHGYVWTVENPIAVLQIVHGMAEFAERYEPFIKAMNQAQITVIAHDHLGHGRSVHPNLPMGYFDSKNGKEALIQDVLCVSHLAQKRYPNLPHFILGHSMGSFITREAISLEPSLYTGAIIMGTAGSHPEVHLTLPVTHILNKLNPTKVNHILDKLTFGLYHTYFEENSDFNWLNRDPHNIKFYEENPWTGQVFTNNGFHTLYRLIRDVNSVHWYHKINSALPLLIVSGDADPVGNMGKGPKEVYQKLLKHGHQDIQLKLYPDLRHEILNEPESPLVIQDILDWINQHI